jgi:hypothetical protein
MTIVKAQSLNIYDCILQQVIDVDACDYRLSKLAEQYGFPYDFEDMGTGRVTEGLPLLQTGDDGYRCFEMVYFSISFDSDDISDFYVYLPEGKQYTLKELSAVFGEFEPMPVSFHGTFSVDIRIKPKTTNLSYMVSLEARQPITENTVFSSIRVYFDYRP